MDSSYKPVPIESNFSCRKCESKDIEFYEVESFDGAFDEYHYHCKGCGRYWTFYDGDDS